MIKNNNIITFVVISLLLLVLSSCKTSKNIVGHQVDISNDTTENQIFKGVHDNQFQFNWLSIKFDAFISTTNATETFSGNLRMKKDSAIWISIRKFGLEIARFFITPDTVKVMNRIEKGYFIDDFDAFNKYIGINVDFYLLQALLTANDFSADNASCEVSFDEELSYISIHCPNRTLNNILNDSSYIKPFEVEQWLLVDTPFYRIKYNAVKPVDDNRILKAWYENFQPVEGKTSFPRKLTFEIEDASTSTLIITVNKVKEGDPVKMPIKIPGKYKKMLIAK